ncbi:hypothetical protein H0261_03035 [Pectobacterium versatile]|uniref:hypothetical protein n=1 Tax=Pectobacterium TaxID=122277 RepID=UPI0015DFA815|nr:MULTISPECIES: hypothetical protein [Pectobacterium]MBA0182706.1 hypothetical protein [Pectobacterium versatile]UVD99396.1 hypothetical protein NV347_10610 [Pectobacterium parvum]
MQLRKILPFILSAIISFGFCLYALSALSSAVIEIRPYLLDALSQTINGTISSNDLGITVLSASIIYGLVSLYKQILKTCKTEIMQELKGV